MHILLIHQAFASLNEPGGTRHHELARFLAGCGHRVTIIASPVSYLTGRTLSEAMPSQPPQVSNDGAGGGVTIIRAYTYPALHRSFVRRVFSFLSFMVSSFLVGLRVRRVDLVWGTSPPIFQGITAWALARLKGAPFLFEVRDLWPAFAVGVGVLRQPLLIRLSEWLEGFLYRHANRVVVNSPGFIEHVRQRGASRVDLVPNSDGGAFRRENALEGKFVALYAGAHGMSNDLGVLLQAAQLLADRPQVAIVLLGDGKEKPALIDQARALGLKNATFLPPIAKAGMSQALAAADACIAILKPIPLYATVYPNKVFDYMAAGRPVVLAIDGVIRQVVEQAGAGLFIPPGDADSLAQAIRRLADDPQLGKSMGARGRQAVEKSFDRAHLARQLADIMQMMGEKG
jgi:glycosyltransferase involved in cell wall biosynthesis